MTSKKLATHTLYGTNVDNVEAFTAKTYETLIGKGGLFVRQERTTSTRTFALYQPQTPDAELLDTEATFYSAGVEIRATWREVILASRNGTIQSPIPALYVEADTDETRAVEDAKGEHYEPIHELNPLTAQRESAGMSYDQPED